MKKEFSKKWQGSKLPRKQRKFVAKLPLHLKKKILSVNLSKDLRKKYGKRNIAVRKGDKVKIMRGKFAKKDGKVMKILKKYGKIYVEGVQYKKKEGSKVDAPMKASNLQIIELDLEDRKRNKILKENKKPEKSKKGEKKVKEEKEKKNAS